MKLIRVLSKSAPILVVVALAALAASCSKSSYSPTGPIMGGTSASGGAITITGSGVAPKTLTVGYGAKVTITNNDSARRTSLPRTRTRSTRIARKSMHLS